MDEPITITEADIDTEKGSRSRLKVGTQLRREEMLHLALMSSENRAAAAPTVREDTAPAPKRAGRAQAPVEEPAPQPEPEFMPDPQPDVQPAPHARAQEELELADEATTSADGDDAGARLIALNMALNGSSREETEAYLAEYFDLTDPEALLDDVYARAGQ
jgi:hypothetical protein